MQISGNYRSQSLPALLRETQSSPLSGSSKNNESSGAGSPSNSISNSLGYAGLQSRLAESSLGTGTEAGGVTQRNAAGQTLDDVIASGKVINPADWLSGSDIDLFHEVTGGTIKDGVIYDANGDEDTREKSNALVMGLYEMRNEGTFDSSDSNRVAISGAITADDLQNYISHYAHGGWISSDTNVLQDALDALDSQKA